MVVHHLLEGNGCIISIGGEWLYSSRRLDGRLLPPHLPSGLAGRVRRFGCGLTGGVPRGATGGSVDRLIAGGERRFAGSRRRRWA